MSKLPIKPSDGEYDWPDGKASSAYLRQHFLSRVRELVPEVFEELYDNTFEIYQEVKPDYYSFSYNKLRELVKQPESVQKLIRILNQWAQKYNLNTKWCLQVAYDSVRAWSFYPERPVRWPLHSVVLSADYPTDLPEPPEGWAKYDPLTTRRLYYVNYVLEEARKVIQNNPFLKHGEPSHRKYYLDSIAATAEEYCIKIENYLACSGYKPVGQTRNLDRYMNWTVEFQIKRLTLTEIASKSDVALSTVKRAVVGDLKHNPPIQGMLELIGLPRRPESRQGRRYGSNTSETARERGRVLRQLGRR